MAVSSRSSIDPESAPLHRAWFHLAWCTSAAFAWSAAAQVCPLRLLNAPGEGAPIETSAATGSARLLVYSAASDDPIAEAQIEPGRGDLFELFPDLLALADGSPLFAQLEIDGVASGSPLVVEPLMPLPRATDAWSARVVAAMDANDRPTIESLLKMPAKARELLRQRVELADAAPISTPALRIYEERLISLVTENGEIRIGLRADAAPRTAFHFRSLAEAGFLDGTLLSTVHDVASRSAVLIRGGGTPEGSGCGWTIPFEASALAQGVGVVSAARIAGEPNSASSEYVIVLEPDSTRGLEGCCVPFGVLVGGAEVIEALNRRRAESLRVIRAGLVAAPAYAGPHQAIALERQPADDDAER